MSNQAIKLLLSHCFENGKNNVTKTTKTRKYPYE